MSAELDFQTKMVIACRELGGAGQKLTNRFTSGVPDLLLKVPGEEAVLAEAKMVRMPDRDNSRIKIQSVLTRLQLDFLLKWQAAGAHAGILMCYKTYEADHVLFTTDVETVSMITKMEFMDRCKARLRGSKLSSLITQGLLSRPKPKL